MRASQSAGLGRIESRVPTDFVDPVLQILCETAWRCARCRIIDLDTFIPSPSPGPPGRVPA